MTDETGVHIVVSPNASMTWLEAKWFLAGISTLILLIAAGFAMMGLWLVFPFAGLEVLVLSAVFYTLIGKGVRQEVVHVNSERVRVEAGGRHLEQSCCFHRVWTQVLLEPEKIRGYPTRLLLRSAGKQVEVGAFLNNDERQTLWLRLKQLIEGPWTRQEGTTADTKKVKEDRG